MRNPTKSEVLAIIDTYEGMLAHCNDGEGSDRILAELTKWENVLAEMETAGR